MNRKITLVIICVIFAIFSGCEKKDVVCNIGYDKTVLIDFPASGSSNSTESSQ